MSGTTDETHPGYIRLQIDMNYDARSQGYFIKAPSDWATWDEETRQAYLNERADEYLNEQIDAHGTYYATAKEAAEDNQGGWSLSFDPDNVDEENEE